MRTDVACSRPRELTLDGTSPPGARLTEMEAAEILEMSRGGAGGAAPPSPAPHVLDTRTPARHETTKDDRP